MTQASFAQHGMWITEGLGSAGSAYHMPLLIHFHGHLDVGALSKACSAVVERHPILASALLEDDGVVRLVPAATEPECRIASPGESVDEEIARAFDLAGGPLIRFALFDGRTLVVTAHHHVFDGQSKDLLVHDLLAFLDDEDLSPLPSTFAEHADAERTRVGAALAEAGRFWRTRWREPAPVVVAGGLLSSRGAGPGQVLDFTLPRPELGGLTVFETALAALHALLFLYGNARVTTALDLSTRTPETAELAGPFVNEVPIATEPDGDLPFRAFARSLREECRRIYTFREVPLARAVPGVRPHAALAPISVSYRRRRPSPGRHEVDWLAFNGSVRGDLQLQLVDDGQSLTAGLRYSPQAAGIAPLFAGHLQAIMSGIAQGSDARLADLLAVERVAVPHTTATPAPAPSAAVDEELLTQVRRIWEEVIGIEPIGIHDDIFDLGGHSLTITQIIARMQRRLGIEVPLDDFFDNPTIAGVLDAVNVR